MIRSRILQLTLLLLLPLPIQAQSIATPAPCGFPQVMQFLEQQHPGFTAQFDATFRQPSSRKPGTRTTAQVYRIPVVFHVVYHTSRQNLPDSVVFNQLRVLNTAFRKRHADTGKVRDLFKPLSGDAGIEFYLAPQDPDGHPSTGITRTFTNTPSFGILSSFFPSIERIKYSSRGGQDPWPTNRYLNIWIADMTDPNAGQPFLLGYATPPMNPLPTNWAGTEAELDGLLDGVVLQYQAVGSNNPYQPDLGSMATAGRTAVHEVGHYLGLRHISGDAAGTPEQCTHAGDDGIGDTPLQGAQSQQGHNGGCPSYAQNTCDAGVPDDLPDMWENYMDYSGDACQTLFTQGQITHMQNILTHQRDTLAAEATESRGLLPIFRLYPQPASAELRVELDGPVEEIMLFSLPGQRLAHLKGAEAGSKRYDVRLLPSGSYLLLLRSGEQRYAATVVISH